MSALAAAGVGLGLGSVTLLASGTGGADWIGVSSTIAAVSGLIATVTVSIVQLVRLFRREPTDDETIAKAVEEGLRRAKRRDRRAS